MTKQPESGELLVGAYFRLVKDCELVSYNRRSQNDNEQTEIDVISMKNSEDTVYICEVATHLDGLQYRGTPKTDKWAEYGNTNYQKTLEKIEDKFLRDWRYAKELFDSDKELKFQFWSPVVRGNREEKYLLGGLYAVTEEFEETTGTKLELVINEEFSERIGELQKKASKRTKDHGELGFRILQILEHLR